MIARNGEEYRRRIMECALFAGCLTGRRILQAFDDACLGEIRWEESTREICGDPKTVPAPDPEHIRSALQEQRPAVVLTFGTVAGDAVAAIWTGLLIRAPHPAARQATVPDELLRVAEQLRDALKRANAEVSDSRREKP